MQANDARSPFAEFSIELTEDHLRRVFTAAIANSGEWKLAIGRFHEKVRANHLATALFAVAFFVVLALTVFDVVSERFAPMLLLGTAVSAGTSAWHGQQLRTQLKALKSGDLWLKQAVEGGAIGPWSISFSDLGVRSRLNNTDTTYRWEHFSSVEQWPSHVAVLASQGTSMFIPAELFTNEEAAELFVRRVHAMLEAHTCTAAHRVAAYLRDHSMPCPKCRYELRGNQTGACPECGTTLSFENVPAARSVVVPPRT